MISKSRRDSVGGGGVVAEFFADLQKPTRFSGGGGRTIHFPKMGPFYIFRLSQRGGPGPRAPGPPPLNRPLQSFLEWIVEGQPKHGTVFDDMKLSRARFKYELRCLKRHKDQQIGDYLANKLQDSKPEHFWKEINRISKCKVTLPNCIDGATGANNICELWKNHFHQLLNSIQDDDALHVDPLDVIITLVK